jgi:tRNA nucleotidyltransferase (CCA-adding enzyme)
MARLQAASARAVRRLARLLEPATIEELAAVMTADVSGRPPKPRGEPESVRALRAMAAELALGAAAPRPILLGRHLVARGFRPGPRFKEILGAGFEAQLDGEFADEPGAERWLDAWLRGG